MEVKLPRLNDIHRGKVVNARCQGTVLWWISCQDTIKVKLPRYYGNQVGKVMYKSSCQDIVGVKVL